jgi:hypothetical protein
MDERDMEKERQNGKRNGWGLERHRLFFFWNWNGKAHRENKALFTTLFLPLYFGFKKFFTILY